MFSRQNSIEISEWEKTRYLSAMSLNSNPYLKKAYQPKDLFSLPNDKKSNHLSKKEFLDNVLKAKKHLPFNIA